MRRFRFSLQKVLQLRTQLVEQAKRSLAYALAMEEQADRERREGLERLRCGVIEAGRLESEGLGAYGFGSGRAYLGRLQRESQAAGARLRAAQAETGRRREALLAARLQQRVLERLREQRLAEHTATAVEEEQKELDQFGAALRHSSRAPGLGI
jgi:flagellar export protein FliJ